MASSTDGGVTFTPTKVDDSYTQSQGTALVAHPTNGQMYVFWRSFLPNTIVMSKRGSNGNWSKPVDILAGEAVMAPFDQPMLGAPTYAFRTNAFPTAAITPDGNSIFVAWQELWSDGLPRVVVKQINSGTLTGPARTPAATTRPASPPGLGFFSPTATAAGPQVMPSISCSVGPRCMLTYYEGRGGLTGGWIAGQGRVLDVRGVIVTPGPAFTPSVQITRYGYEPPIALNGKVNQPVIDWLAAALGGGLEGTPSVNASQICPPDQPLCYASLDYSWYPHTGAGTVPFMGDYTDVQPVVPYVYKAGKWQVPVLASDVPSDSAFVAAWADNRNVVPPADGNWSNYAPPGTGGTSCANPGSRDQSVMTAQLGSGLLITAPTNFKPVPAGTQVAFPMTVWNSTGNDMTFSLKLTGNAGASFAKDPPTSGEYLFPLRDGELSIFAYSSSSIYVYLTDPAPFTVTATGGTLASSMTFNAPEANTGGTYANQATGLTVAPNPVPKNPVPKNPVPKNPVPKNPVPKNVPLPDGTTYTQVYGVRDYSVTVSADETNPGDVGAYLALFNIDKAYQDSYVFQVFITKPTYAFEVVDGCDSQNRALGAMVSNISDPSNPVPKNPVPKNPVPKNPVPKNATLSDALVQNSTFTLGSNGGGTVGTLSALSTAPTGGCDASGNGLIGDCTKAASRDPNQVVVTLRAYQVKDNPPRIFDPNGESAPATPPSLFVADRSCTDNTNPRCIFITDGPDLAVPDPPAAGVTPTTVPLGQPVTFPSQTVTVTNKGTREPTVPYVIGFYLSSATTIAGLPRNANGTIQTDGTTYTKLLGSVPATGTQDVQPASLTIPVDTPFGTYYLYAYVDSERVVSELDEDNNIVQGGPVTIALPVPTVSVTGGTFTYDGAQHPASGFAYGVGGISDVLTPAVTFSYQGSGATVYGPSATAPVGAGTYKVTASFAGNASYAPASNATTLTITQAVPNVSVVGGTFAYDGNAHPATATASGVSGTSVTGTFVLTYNGVASIPVNAGTYAVTAAFTSSNANYSNAVGFGTIFIGLATPVVTVGGGPFTYDGMPHSATATAKSAGGATVAGTFSFIYTPGGSSAPVAVGQYSVTATFTSSDPNYGSASGTGSITINRAPTATTLASSSNPSSLGKAVTFTAKVTTIAPAVGQPTGTVTFKDGATTLGAGALANVGGTATATFTTSSLSAGSHPITGVYGGDTTFLASTSAPLTQTVSYVFSGFQTPLATAGTLQSPTNSGTQSFSRVIPIKWQLTDGNGAVITDLKSASPLSVTFAGATCPGAPTSTTVLLYSPTQGAAGGSTFRSGSSGFNFNWDATKNATIGCWWIRLKLADGSPEKVTTVQLQ